MRCQDCQRERRSLQRGRCGACYKAWRRNNAPPNVVCERCGRAYFEQAPKRHTLCSRACFAAWKLGRNGHNELTDGAKQVVRTCLWCGRLFGVEQTLVARGGGRYCTTRCWGIARRKDPTRSSSPENSWRQWRGFLKVRDALLHAPGSSCVRCGEIRTHNNLVVHHRVPPKGNPALLFEPTNLELLCRRCHIAEHRARGDLRVA